MKTIFFKILLSAAAVSFVSCSDWLDIEPDGQATNNKLTQTGDGYRSMLSGVYKAMTSANLYGTELQFGIVDCMSRQYTWDWYTSTDASKTIYSEARDFNYTDVNLREKIDKIWLDGYNVIANANNLIQSIENENPDKFAGGESEKNMILGEAYGCRALMHFDLCRLFAPAPIENESGDYLPYVEKYPNIQPKSISVDEFLDKVVADLQRGRELTAAFDTTALGMTMNSSSNARFYDQYDYGMDGANTPETIDDFYKGRGYRLNYYAMTALLARVYEYMGKDDLAYAYADSVMNSKAIGLAGTEYSMFTNEDWWTMQSAGDENESRQDIKVVSTLIFALYCSDTYDDYNLENYFQKSSTSSFGNPQWMTVDLEGQEIFKNSQTQEDESGSDYRSRYLLFAPDYYVFQDNKYRLSGKWYCSDDVTLRNKNLQTLPMIRTTEMYYIMAEHKARTGDFDGAYEILNNVRSNRGLWNPLETKRDLDSFLKDMICDAQREYISEGQLFYLYKRLGAKLKIGNETRKYTKSEYMLPIPEDQNM